MIKKLMVLLVVLSLSSIALAANSPYVYKFPKPEAGWGSAVSFSNLSPGFFQVMFQNDDGVVRIATYGIVGASMDKLKDPQLMMVFAFEKEPDLALETEEGIILAEK